MNFKNPVIGKLYKYLALKSKEAYRDHLLISNVVLNKQETRGRVLEAYLAGETPLRISFLLALKKIILYSIKNFFGLILCLVTAMFHRLSGQKFCIKVIFMVGIIVTLVINAEKGKGIASMIVVVKVD